MNDTAEKQVLLRLNDVGVSYKSGLSLFGSDRQQVLTGLNLELYAGETLGVLGRNGAGKSTLMALLADIISPDQGTIDRYTRRVQLLSLQMGMTQNLTGRQNVIMVGLLLGMSKKQIDERIDSIIEFAELEDKIDEPIRNYSTGMRARLGFAISVQSDPDILLIDEVLSVGDAAFRPKARKVILDRLQARETVVIVSHSEDTLAEYCDRVAWIDRGMLRMVETTEEVIAAYRDSVSRAGSRS